ncbi:hypothetical protein PHLCEN_2v10260 [Hermanssonia centrifuga]|uniref:Uncharacterized protein n=1 Tax=Hermanssonia centrifuga TaxID=98765 RepID=A0A2R6NNL1_9APHY|nr:hypothetical protein PHLCEN_2v10260 [Hermanssonia centrifuga]
MVAVSLKFGSVGDIVTVIQLAWSIQQALSETKGSSAEYRMLVDYLKGFSDSLEAVKPLILNPRTTLELSAVNALRWAIGTCEKLMRDFQLKITSYAGSLAPGGSGSWLIDVRQKIGWFTSVKGDAIDLRLNLCAQGEIINRIVSASTAWVPSLCSTKGKTKLIIGLIVNY